MDIRKTMYFKKSVSAIVITVLLISFMMKASSFKIIYVPFLICSISMAAENIALYLEKSKIAALFHKMFVVGFLSFWFGIIFMATDQSIDEKNDTFVVFTIPFWLVGIGIAKKALFHGKTEEKRRKKDTGAPAMWWPIVMSTLLVLIVLLIGIAMLILGIKNGKLEITVFGAFFLFGGLAFVLAFLSIKGCFDRWNIDIIGLYMGSFLAIVGIGSVVLKYTEMNSIEKTLEAFGFWILVPVVMIAGGSAKIVQCIKERHEEE